MTQVNKHGLQLQGLRRAAGYTHDKRLTGAYSADYVQISYDIDDDRIYTDWHCSRGGNSWSQYRGNVITVCNAHEPMTMRQIADAIAEAVAMR